MSRRTTGKLAWALPVAMVAAALAYLVWRHRPGAPVPIGAAPAPALPASSQAPAEPSAPPSASTPDAANPPPGPPAEPPDEPHREIDANHQMARIQHKDAKGLSPLELVNTPAGVVTVQRTFTTEGKLLKEEAFLNGQAVPVPPREPAAK